MFCSFCSRKITGRSGLLFPYYLYSWSEYECVFLSALLFVLLLLCLEFRSLIDWQVFYQVLPFLSLILTKKKRGSWKWRRCTDWGEKKRGNKHNSSRRRSIFLCNFIIFFAAEASSSSWVSWRISGESCFFLPQKISSLSLILSRYTQRNLIVCKEDEKSHSWLQKSIFSSGRNVAMFVVFVVLTSSFFLIFHWQLYREDSTGTIYVSLSSDSTCLTGLKSATSGYESFILTPNTSTSSFPDFVEASKCRFPDWTQATWEDSKIRGNTFVYKDEEHNYQTVTSKCVMRQTSTSNERFVVYSKTQCGDESYRCIWFKRRSPNIMEFQFGQEASPFYSDVLCDDKQFPTNNWITQGSQYLVILVSFRKILTCSLFDSHFTSCRDKSFNSNSLSNHRRLLWSHPRIKWIVC